MSGYVLFLFFSKNFTPKVQSRNAQRPNPILNCTTLSHNRARGLVTAPLDGVEINTLLNKLPQRTQLTQESNTFLDSLEDVVNLGISGEATDTKTDTAVSALVAAAKSTENV